MTGDRHHRGTRLQHAGRRPYSDATFQDWHHWFNREACLEYRLMMEFTQFFCGSVSITCAGRYLEASRTFPHFVTQII